MLLQKVLLHKKFLMCENNKTEQQILPKVIFGYIPIFVNTVKIIDDFKLILKKEDFILFTYKEHVFHQNFLLFSLCYDCMPIRSSYFNLHKPILLYYCHKY